MDAGERKALAMIIMNCSDISPVLPDESFLELVFEADEKNYSKLIKNTSELKNIECFNIAAWDKNETLLFQKKKLKKKLIKQMAFKRNWMI